MAKLGRRAASEVDRLRVQIWYHHVKAKSGLSDSELNVTFAPSYSKPTRKSEADRQFERIRDRACMPRRRESATGVPDLIERVEAAYPGTASTIDAPLWEMMTSWPVTLSTANAYVVKLLQKWRLRRRAGDMDFEVPEHHFSGPTDVSLRHRLYRAQLELHLKDRTPDLDMIGLLVALYREAYLSPNLDLAVYLRNLIREKVCAFCEVPWMEPVWGDFAYLVNARALSVARIEEDQLNGYYAFEVVLRPIVQRPRILTRASGNQAAQGSAPSPSSSI